MKNPFNQPSRRLSLGAAVGLAILAAPGLGHAVQIANITFSEVALGTTDPAIAGFSFFAGDNALFADTITDDGVTPANPYLLSGIDDQTTDYLPGLANTSFIGASHAGTLGGLNMITQILVDAAFISTLPVGSTLVMEALLGGVVQGSASFTDSSPTPVYQSLGITLNDLGFDSLRFYGNADNEFSFRIDNLRVDVTQKTTPPPSGVPEPATLWLTAGGLLGLARRAGRRA